MAQITTHNIGIIMNGVTGRMGTNQHLMRSIAAIRQQGGVKLSDHEIIMPDPILVGRNEIKLQEIAKRAGITKWSTDPEAILSDPAYSVYFDAQTTNRRVEWVQKAIRAGKHIYCEKPTALTTQEAYQLYAQARDAGVKHGVVQDKLWLPGFLKLKRLIDAGFFGEILSVRGEFGYWVFEGDLIEPQRPSWNYRQEDGGGIISDMLCHWRYLLDNIFGKVKAVSCLGATHVKTRWDEQGKPYNCTAEDAAYSTFELEGGIIAHFNSSWTVRVRRDDLVTLQVDGTKGSAVAGLRQCYIQPYAATPRPIWNPDIESPINYMDNWQVVPDNKVFENAFKIQWELFLRHLVTNEPFPWNLREGAKGVQLVEKGMESWQKRAWVDVPELEE
ncbi:oxidoreductase domain protein [Candidatus Moduliflexus flocculans]|uniref:Oxidoreductase domain protein n=1 Tax=Candidatus Moduliflexus flocculans TaxID=1499966 RepID=A0A0S6W4U0_9BACT|nr:oxidoreductase domain protein [Candidatus Moduliflexus flocculans]